MDGDKYFYSNNLTTLLLTLWRYIQIILFIILLNFLFPPPSPPPILSSPPLPRSSHLFNSLISPPQFPLLNPRHHPREDDDRREKHSPQPNMGHSLIIIRLGRCRDRDECQDYDQIAAYAMVLVNGFGVVHASKQGRKIKLHDANQTLDDEQNIGDETQNGVWGFKVGAPVVDFVVLDDDEAGDERKKAGAVECGVDVRAELLLFGGMGGLEDQDSLRDEEEAGGVEKLRGVGSAFQGGTEGD